MSKTPSYRLSSYRGGIPEVRGRRRAATAGYFVISATLFGIGSASLITFVASAFSITFLKPVAILMLILGVIGTVLLLRNYGGAIHTPKALCMLVLLSVIPELRIAFEVVPTLQPDRIIDGLFIFGPYYLLPFSGLAVVAFLASTSTRFDVVLKCYFIPTTVLIVLFTAGGYYTLNSAQVAGTYTIYNNLLIPAALLLFFPSSRVNVLLGIVALSTILVLSTLQASRSYLLVVLYIGVFALLLSGRGRGTTYLFAAFLGLLVFLAAPFAAQLNLFTDGSVYEKLRLDTLVPAVREVMRSGDLLALYFWEGNSRAGIILDAFWDFSLWDYWWGRGVSATYVSFVVRRTIEIGYAQEMFWLGLATVVPTLTFAFLSLGGILKRRRWRTSHTGAAFIGIGLTRIIDGFIYGPPSLSLYALVFWMLVMSFALKTPYRHILFDPS